MDGLDGALEGAAGLCACKLACSLLFLPSLTEANSAISFCCCCLMIFTDFFITVFLSLLSIFESWLPELTPSADIIALRFLLLLGDIYGAVLLLTAPLIAVETLVRYLWPHAVTPHRTLSSYAGEEVTMEQEEEQGEEEEEEEDSSNSVEDTQLSPAFSYFCCLFVWFIIAFSVRWKWKVNEVWVMACLHSSSSSSSSSSIVRCLPKLFNSVLGTVNPCFCIPALFLPLLLLLTIMLQQQQKAAAQTHRKKAIETKVDNHWKETERTKKDFPEIIVSAEKHVDVKLSGCGWLGFPCPEAKVMTGWMSVIFVLVLPLNLSVNILLIRTIEALLEHCIESIVPIAENTGEAPPSDIEIQV